LLSLLLFAGAVLFWQLGERWAGRGPGAAPEAARPRSRALDATPRAFRQSETFQLLSAAAVSQTSARKSPASLRRTRP